MLSFGRRLVAVKHFRLLSVRAQLCHNDKMASPADVVTEQVGKVGKPESKKKEASSGHPLEVRYDSSA